MRISAGAIANGAAWVAFAAIFAGAVIMTDVLGFLGLFVIGAFTWLACVRALQDDDPGWQPFRIYGRQAPGRPEPPEQRAARHWEWEVTREPIRFFARCGMAVTAIGAAGFAWQIWFAAASNGH